MFRKAFFKDTPREKIKQAMHKDGFTPKIISDSPNYIYEPHQHPETKYLVCLEGSMAVTVKGRVYKFEPGDKLIIPGNTMHSALVGREGCVFFWSEKVV
jgi:mannose-6-phosphate isomerase-like protein (cupin superfamily)